jgi:hypothetical protein
MPSIKAPPRAGGKAAPTKFDFPAMKAQFARLVAGGAKKIAIVDYYMGGKTASELSKMLRDLFTSDPKYDGVTVEVHWIREAYGKAEAGGTVLDPLRGSPSPGAKGAAIFSQTQEVVSLALGDDMTVVMSDSRAPLQIFDETGKVVRTVEPKPGQTTRQALIELLNAQPE